MSNIIDIYDRFIDYLNLTKFDFKEYIEDINCRSYDLKNQIYCLILIIKLCYFTKLNVGNIYYMNENELIDIINSLLKILQDENYLIYEEIIDKINSELEEKEKEDFLEIQEKQIDNDKFVYLPSLGM